MKKKWRIRLRGAEWKKAMDGPIGWAKMPVSRMTLSRVLILSFALAWTFFAWASIPPIRRFDDADSEQKIRVRLAEAVPLAQIRGFDLKILETESRKLAAEPARVSEWEFRCQDGRIRAVSVKGGKSLDLRSPVVIRTPAGFIRYRGRPYREEIRIHSEGSLCEVVNEVDVEKYLSGLVNSEFNSKWSQEAIAAQVVAARTYAYFQIQMARRNPSLHFDVDASVKDQVYDGSVKEDHLSALSVNRTKGWVLTVGSDSAPVPLKAFYHSTCAGRTELPQNVWGGSSPGFKRAVTCPYCAKAPGIRWKLDLSTAEIARAIRRGAGSEGAPARWPSTWRQALQAGKLLDLRVTAYNAETRVSTVTTSWAVGKSVVELSIPGPRFRDWLGPGRLKSTAFQVVGHRPYGTQSWMFEGRGNGHGVGMCQWGAKTMGEKGFKMAGILKHYYPDAILRKLW